MVRCPGTAPSTATVLPCPSVLDRLRRDDVVRLDAGFVLGLCLQPPADSGHVRRGALPDGPEMNELSQQAGFRSQREEQGPPMLLLDSRGERGHARVAEQAGSTFEV